MSRRERSCKDAIVPPTPPHPTPSHLKRCHVECDSTYVEEGTMLSVAAGRNAAAWTLLSPQLNPPHPSASKDDALLVVAASVSNVVVLPSHPTPPDPTPPPHLKRCHVECDSTYVEQRSCKDVIVPPHPNPPRRIWRRRKERSCKNVIVLPHPTPPHAMLSVTARMSRRERSCKDVIVPPHPRIWRLCHVECGCTCAKRRNAAVRTVLFPPTPPPALGDDATQSVDARILVANWRGFWFPNRADFGCGIVLFWFPNRLFLVAESSVFGCGSAFFWLRKRLFLVAEAYLILVAESPKFGYGSAEIWLRNRRLFDWSYTIHAWGKQPNMEVSMDW